MGLVVGGRFVDVRAPRTIILRLYIIFPSFSFFGQVHIRRDGDALHISGVVWFYYTSASWTTKATTVEQMAIGIVAR